VITPEMYQNAKDRIEHLERELRQCQEIGNNLIVENVQIKAELDRVNSELEGWRRAKTWADTP
jgi:hypothetical protein